MPNQDNESQKAANPPDSAKKPLLIKNSASSHQAEKKVTKPNPLDQISDQSPTGKGQQETFKQPEPASLALELAKSELVDETNLMSVSEGGGIPAPNHLPELTPSSDQKESENEEFIPLTSVTQLPQPDLTDPDLIELQKLIKSKKERIEELQEKIEKLNYATKIFAEFQSKNGLQVERLGIASDLIDQVQQKVRSYQIKIQKKQQDHKKLVKIFDRFQREQKEKSTLALILEEKEREVRLLGERVRILEEQQTKLKSDYELEQKKRIATEAEFDEFHQEELRREGNRFKGRLRRELQKIFLEIENIAGLPMVEEVSSLRNCLTEIETVLRENGISLKEEQA